MEIRPLRSHHLPRYAAALAAVVTAGMLTGCRTAGEIATEGTAPDPNTSYHGVVELTGDAAAEPSDPANADELCTGDDAACETEYVTAGETQQVALVGIAPVRVEP